MYVLVMEAEGFEILVDPDLLALVERRIDELLMWWWSLKDDVRKDRLERNNVIVY